MTQCGALAPVPWESRTEPLWTLEQGLALVRRLEPALIAAGWHVALGGGVLHKGSSDHDLDLLVYPHCRKSSHRPQIRGLRRALHGFGFHPWRSHAVVTRYWRKKGLKGCKWVEVWMYDGSRVDVIVLS